MLQTVTTTKAKKLHKEKEFQNLSKNKESKINTGEQNENQEGIKERPLRKNNKD